MPRALDTKPGTWTCSFLYLLLSYASDTFQDPRRGCTPSSLIPPKPHHPPLGTGPPQSCHFQAGRDGQGCSLERSGFRAGYGPWQPSRQAGGWASSFKVGLQEPCSPASFQGATVPGRCVPPARSLFHLPADCLALAAVAAPGSTGSWGSSEPRTLARGSTGQAWRPLGWPRPS